MLPASFMHHLAGTRRDQGSSLGANESADPKHISLLFLDLTLESLDLELPAQTAPGMLPGSTGAQSHPPEGIDLYLWTEGWPRGSCFGQMDGN